MQTLTLEIPDKDVNFVMDFAQRLGINVYGYQKPLQEDELERLKKIIEKGVTESSIEDPVVWQREQRISRKYPTKNLSLQHGS